MNPGGCGELARVGIIGDRVAVPLDLSFAFLRDGTIGNIAVPGRLGCDGIVAVVKPGKAIRAVAIRAGIRGHAPERATTLNDSPQQLDAYALSRVAGGEIDVATDGVRRRHGEGEARHVW